MSWSSHFVWKWKRKKKKTNCHNNVMGACNFSDSILSEPVLVCEGVASLFENFILWLTLDVYHVANNSFICFLPGFFPLLGT